MTRSDRLHAESLNWQRKQYRRAKVQIINPVPGKSSMTSADQAMRYIERGSAEWRDGKLFFLYESASVRAAKQSALEYDRIRRKLSHKEIRRIPFVGCIDQLFR